MDNELETDEETRDILRQVLQAIRRIRFGSVEITIHDSRVVQIEQKEKVRFDRPAKNARRD